MRRLSIRTLAAPGALAVAIVLLALAAPLLPLADRHVVIEKGRVAWAGTSAELSADPTVKDRFLHV